MNIKFVMNSEVTSAQSRRVGPWRRSTSPALRETRFVSEHPFI